MSGWRRRRRQAGGPPDLRPRTTLDYPRRQQWVASTVLVARPDSPVRLVSALVRSVPRRGTVILNGSSSREQVAAVVLRRVRSDVRAVLVDCTWKRGTNSLDRVASRAVVRLLDGPRTTFCVLSREEAERFPTTWGVPASHVRTTLWYHGLTEAELEQPAERTGHVFAGGDSLRDYAPLIEAARDIVEPVRIATRLPLPTGTRPLPPHVLYGPLPEAEYRARMLAASVVVVALAGGTERSAGQNNYLNPMALGKLVIVTDGTGVREYVRHRETGLVVPSGDAGALRDALQWALDPGNAVQVEQICAEAARDVRSRFGPDGYVRRVLEAVDPALL